MIRAVPRRASGAIVVGAALLACGGSDATRPAASALCPPPSSDALAAPIPCAAPGSGSVALTGTVPRTFASRAGAFEQGGTRAFTVIDAYETDGAGRPVAELFVFLRAAASPGTHALVPVTLSALRDPAYVPPGSFVVYADQYDAARRDYGRWLLADSGRIVVDSVAPGRVGRVRISVTLHGGWRTADDAPLGPGAGTATITAPLLRIRTSTAELRDTTAAALAGARTETMRTRTLDTYQVLAPGQTRLAVVASVASDSTRELWLALPGVPRAGDSLALGAPTRDEALAGRASLPFGMLRVNTTEGLPPRPVIRELWRSTGGWVALTNVVQTGPLGLCGWASGRFHVAATGEALGGTVTPLGTTDADGVFETLFTVLPPGDTLVDAARPPAAGTTARTMAFLAAAPTSSGGTSCSF